MHTTVRNDSRWKCLVWIGTASAGTINCMILHHFSFMPPITDSFLRIDWATGSNRSWVRRPHHCLFQSSLFDFFRESKRRSTQYGKLQGHRTITSTDSMCRLQLQQENWMNGTPLWWNGLIKVHSKPKNSVSSTTPMTIVWKWYLLCRSCFVFNNASISISMIRSNAERFWNGASILQFIWKTSSSAQQLTSFHANWLSKHSLMKSLSKRLPKKWSSMLVDWPSADLQCTTVGQSLWSSQAKSARWARLSRICTWTNSASPDFVWLRWAVNMRVASLRLIVKNRWSLSRHSSWIFCS